MNHLFPSRVAILAAWFNLKALSSRPSRPECMQVCVRASWNSLVRKTGLSCKTNELGVNLLFVGLLSPKIHVTVGLSRFGLPPTCLSRKNKSSSWKGNGDLLTKLGVCDTSTLFFPFRHQRFCNVGTSRCRRFSVWLCPPKLSIFSGSFGDFRHKRQLSRARKFLDFFRSGRR